ncbi:hypothetical protein BYT27DRAFT_7207622, partial [Phlegmacium glaucopus]
VIISAVINAPGSWHDAHIARPIFEQLHSHVPDGHFLVADTAFPRGTASIKGKIRASIKGAEWGMRMIQGSFGRLRVPLKISSPKRRQQLLEIIIRLANESTRYELYICRYGRLQRMNSCGLTLGI